jgi:GT2 family glycosyltransferase
MMVDKSMTFISASPTNNFIWEKNVHTIFESYLPDTRRIVNYDLYPNNKEGLPKVYNKAFEKADTDFIICLHDDIIIHDIQIFEKIIQYSEQFDIMGLAGASSFNIKTCERKSWLTCAADRQRDLHGAVTHPIPNHEGLYHTSSYGYMPARVCNIDGLFMVMSKKVYKNIKFDEKFTFDFYDLDFSLTALENGYKIGVIPLPCTHQSGGYGIMEDKYLTAQENFVKKWEHLFPLKV